MKSNKATIEELEKAVESAEEVEFEEVEDLGDEVDEATSKDAKKTKPKSDKKIDVKGVVKKAALVVGGIFAGAVGTLIVGAVSASKDDTDEIDEIQSLGHSPLGEDRETDTASNEAFEVCFF